MYDITLFGATGHTGRLCAMFIAEKSPTTTQWCLAGRSETKLKELVKELKAKYSDRLQPDIEILPDLERHSIQSVIQQTKVVINGIGPFHRFSTPIVEACAVVGTHYVDFTTETLWIKEMIEKYEHIARESGAILIPGISPTAPADILAWLIARETKEKSSTAPSEIVATGKLDIKAMSSGSLSTVLDSLETWGPGWYLYGDSWVLTNKSGFEPTASRSLLSRIFGYRSMPILGGLTTSFIGPGNASVVHRSASQNPELYGPDFRYEEYLPATGPVQAILVHLLMKTAIILLSIPFIRTLLRKLTDPNKPLPSQEDLCHLESAEYNAVGFIKSTPKPVVKATFLRKGALYEFTALLTCIGAKVLLNHPKGEDQRGEGGFYTPSWLEMEYVEGLKEAGVQIEVGLV